MSQLVQVDRMVTALAGMLCTIFGLVSARSVCVGLIKCLWNIQRMQHSRMLSRQTGAQRIGVSRCPWVVVEVLQAETK